MRLGRGAIFVSGGVDSGDTATATRAKPLLIKHKSLSKRDGMGQCLCDLFYICWLLLHLAFPRVLFTHDIVQL